MRAGELPLAGVRVVECGGIGPGPFAAMMLAEMGAEVVRIERPGAEGLFGMTRAQDPLLRGKNFVELDLADPADASQLRALIVDSDVLIEGFRPGVMERLGFGPEDCARINPRLVYGRMTGWGQSGSRAQEVGHDINYIAVTGALAAIGPGGPGEAAPAVPLNLVGDFGGGSLYLVSGLLAALFARDRTGRGRTVDAAIVDGVCHLMGLVWGLGAAGQWEPRREANLFDGGAPFYRVYATSDGLHIAVGAVEPKFYARFLAVLGLPELLDRQYERAGWEIDRDRIAEAVRRRTRAEWERAFAGVDACVTPVLSLAEAAADEHLLARRSLSADGGPPLPGPAPRFG